MRLRILFFIIGAMIFISCQPEIQVEPSPIPTVPNTPVPRREPARVEAIEIHQVEVQPVEVKVIARGHHTDGCSRIDQINQSQSSGHFEIEIEIVRENDTSCPPLSVKFEELIALDVIGLSAGLYVVDVNGLQGTFTLQEDNIPDQENAVIGGRVWNDSCTLNATGENGTISSSDGCIKDGDGSLVANGSPDSEEMGEGDVLVKLGAGSCPTEGLATTISDEDGFYLFSGLKAGIYCVSIDALDANNVAILRIGEWTFPKFEKEAFAAVEVVPGESNLDINFGWFEQLALPTTTIEEDCTDKAIFKSDVSIPDNTLVAPGETFTKTWELQNIGSCTWDPDYTIVFAGGDLMGAQEMISLTTTTSPGDDVNISVTMVAPVESGEYRGEWKFVNPDGFLFGIGPGSDRPFWVQIEVANS